VLDNCYNVRQDTVFVRVAGVLVSHPPCRGGPPTYSPSLAPRPPTGSGDFPTRAGRSSSVREGVVQDAAGDDEQQVQVT